MEMGVPKWAHSLRLDKLVLTLVLATCSAPIGLYSCLDHDDKALSRFSPLSEEEMALHWWDAWEEFKQCLESHRNLMTFVTMTDNSGYGYSSYSLWKYFPKNWPLVS